MAYIGKVKLSNEWASVKELVRAQVSGQGSFDYGAYSYELQCEGNLGARLCDVASAPTSDSEAGFIIKDTKTAVFKKDAGSTLYAKVVYDGKLTDDVWLKISNLGE